jgi:hypothetical protein
MAIRVGCSNTNRSRPHTMAVRAFMSLSLSTNA